MSFIESAVKAILLTFVAILTLIFLIALAMSSPDQNVATDFVAQYELTKQYGSPVDRCLAAKQVAAAYLQANSTAPYAEWKTIEGEECEEAGLKF